ncbi:MAG: bifunctional glutamate N-acetyltransferase/amino-acid acetyltransferase ArgJ [Chloroflexota bacterium]|nr:bifunctional glutamate N-acetyltransferase/amino-acid acetyltransferase ArgJ [Chloroflexota bacterium]
MTLDVRQPLPIDLPAVDEAPRMPAGFRAGAVAAGIKPSGRLDLGVLAATGDPASVGATFTTNLLRAAPVTMSQLNLAQTEHDGKGNWGRAQAVLSTSGCANAATGGDGERDQQQLMDALASWLGGRPEHVLAMSTGLIGTRLPVDRLRQPLRRLVTGGLATSDEALAALAEQMCTTDTRRKSATVSLDLPAPGGAARTVTVSGIAKGVGMIHPRMATMLALVLTDAAVEPWLLYEMLLSATERTWNQLTVDGDTSTNDTVFLLASGAAGTLPLAAGSDEHFELGRAVMAVARALARQQAADGEGATTLITCQVSGARDDRDARAIARSVVASSLVKAAVHGRDPNWGRIAAAVGNALVDGRPVTLVPEVLAVSIGGLPVFAGAPLSFDRGRLARAMDTPELLIRLDVGGGPGVGEAFGCDLSEQYVIENSAYST